MGLHTGTLIFLWLFYGRHLAFAFITAQSIPPPSTFPNTIPFATSLSLYDNVLAVGSPDSNFYGPSSGAVFTFIFDGINWTFQSVITPRVPQINALFGTSVSLKTGKLVVGAPTYGSCGAIFMFSPPQSLFPRLWIQQKVIYSPRCTPISNFGQSIFQFGNFIFTGVPKMGLLSPSTTPDSNTTSTEIPTQSLAQTPTLIQTPTPTQIPTPQQFIPLKNQNLPNLPENPDGCTRPPGSAFVFDVNNNVFTELTNDDVQSCRVYEYGKIVQILSRGNDTFFLVSGSIANLDYATGVIYVYIYQPESSNQSFQLYQKIISPDPSRLDFFALDFHADNSTGKLAVGAPGNDYGGLLAGAAYIFDFENNRWTNPVVVQPLEILRDFQFGRSIRVLQDTLVASAPKAGCAYIFKFINDSWQEQSIVFSPEFLYTNDWFGREIDLHNGTIAFTTKSLSPSLSQVSVINDLESQLKLQYVPNFPRILPCEVTVCPTLSPPFLFCKCGVLYYASPSHLVIQGAHEWENISIVIQNNLFINGSLSLHNCSLKVNGHLFLLPAGTLNTHEQSELVVMGSLFASNQSKLVIEVSANFVSLVVYQKIYVASASLGVTVPPTADKVYKLMEYSDIVGSFGVVVVNEGNRKCPLKALFSQKFAVITASCKEETVYLPPSLLLSIITLTLSILSGVCVMLYRLRAHCLKKPPLKLLQ